MDDIPHLVEHAAFNLVPVRFFDGFQIVPPGPRLVNLGGLAVSPQGRVRVPAGSAVAALGRQVCDARFTTRHYYPLRF